MSHPLNHNFITVPLQFSVFQSLISDGGHESCDWLHSEETLINVLRLVCNPNTERVLQLQQEEQFDASKFTFKSFMTRLFSCSLVLYFSVNYFDFFNSFLYYFIYIFLRWCIIFFKISFHDFLVTSIICSVLSHFQFYLIMSL